MTGAGRPEIYRIKLGAAMWRDFTASLVVVVTVPVLLLAFLGGAPGGRWPSLLIAIAILVFAWIYFGGACRTLRLWSDRLELSDIVFGRREILRSDIVGFRKRRVARGPAILVVLRQPQRSVRLWQAEAGDALERWFDGIPDLDAAEHAAAERDLLADPTLGATEAERRQTLDRWSNGVKVANAAGGGLGFILLLWDYPPAVVIALGALCPLIALGLAIVARGAVTLSVTVDTARPNVAGLLLPGLALGFRAAMDVHTLDLTHLLEVGAVLAIPVAVVIFLADRRGYGVPKAAAVLALGAFAYGWGLSAEGDALLDAAAVPAYRVQVLDKHRSGSRHTTYHLTLSKWGPFPGERTVEVARDLYLSVDPGQVVCASLHPGAFGGRWYEVGLCR
jgi:hypothetical protein